MKRFFLPSADSPVLQWLGFVLFLVLLFICLGGIVVWLTTRHQRQGQAQAQASPEQPSQCPSIPRCPPPQQTGGLPACQRSSRSASARLHREHVQHSRALTKKSASNLALAFILLPQEKRDAMAALYAFCRAVDDVADEDAVPSRKTPVKNVAAWREDIRRAVRKNQPPQFGFSTRNSSPSLQKFKRPLNLFDELIKGWRKWTWKSCATTPSTTWNSHCYLRRFRRRPAEHRNFLAIKIPPAAIMPFTWAKRCS